MALQLIFAVFPRTKGSSPDGIQEPSTVTELAGLYHETPTKLTSGNLQLSLPDKMLISNLNIKSVELKNLLLKYAGQTIYIYDPDPASYATSAEVLKLP